MDKSENRYNNLINIPRPKATRPLSMSSRAAQFAPFAALTGYDEVIEETSRPLQDENFVSGIEYEIFEEEP